MDLTIDTPRLRLTRLTNSDIDSEHLKWFHEFWTDDAATTWRYGILFRPVLSLHSHLALTYDQSPWKDQHIRIKSRMDDHSTKELRHLPLRNSHQAFSLFPT
jgi:hypothetical protein